MKVAGWLPVASKLSSLRDPLKSRAGKPGLRAKAEGGVRGDSEGAGPLSGSAVGGGAWGGAAGRAASPWTEGRDERTR
ncbi:PREDICTED: NF-kappa-B inhibitor epsilon-like [Chrysochloris asiatica]|uniref:NF-kappa-B inhibitor epsilon-like n=1 Tax=Chrysochloris asiatica TaxID=185453 RepID=A0A9B0T8W9_CHRAS|nr:PREDICTED: NF-kappa-B inhibitor epsilon-like [Chrysochloris asiatica]